jgi:hypothetical protein
MKSYTLLFLFFTLFVGAQTPISKSLGEFSELKIYDLINVELIESTENKIEISGDNATDLNVVQKNDVLKIRMALHKSLNGKNTFVKLFYTKIHTIDVNEGAKVTSESPFKQYELELKAQEGGTISVKTDTKILTIKSVTGGVIETSGTTESQNLNIRTGGIYNGSQLKAINTKIKIKAGGNVDVNSSDLIEVRMIAGGNLTIHGTTKHLKETNRIGGTISFID